MKKRFIGIDLIRGIAAFGIVGCHLELPVGSKIADFFLHFCDLNVAVFAAISGFVMYEKLFDTPTGAYIVKRIKRLLPLYLVWSCVYVLFSFLFKVFAHASLDQYGDVGFWIGVLFRGGAACHLWFIVCLIYMQVAMRIFLRPKAPVWLLLMISFALVYTASNVGENWYGFYMARLMGFVLLGYCLRAVTSKISRFGTFGLSLIFVCSLAIHWLASTYVPLFMLDCIVVIPLVVLASTVVVEDNKCIRVITFFAETSLGVYLFHPLFARAGGLILKKLFTVPYGLLPVLVDWLGVWLLALLSTWIFLHVQSVRKVLR